jgi:hypothetical protein
MITESELKSRRKAARNGFLSWQLPSIAVFLILALGTGIFAAFTERPMRTGDLLVFLLLFFLALRQAVRLLDRSQLVRALGDIWKALHAQQNESPPSFNLLYSLDELRGSLVTYAKSSLGYHSASDLHIPRLRREMDLSFNMITEQLHRAKWKQADVFGGGLNAPTSNNPPDSSYEFVLSWTDELCKQLLGGRRKNRLFENRILALSYFFDDTVAYFGRVHPTIASSCNTLVNETTLRQQERRRAFLTAAKDLGIAVGSVAATWGLTLLRP